MQQDEERLHRVLLAFREEEALQIAIRIIDLGEEIFIPGFDAFESLGSVLRVDLVAFIPVKFHAVLSDDGVDAEHTVGADLIRDLQLGIGVNDVKL